MKRSGRHSVLTRMLSSLEACVLVRRDERTMSIARRGMAPCGGSTGGLAAVPSSTLRATSTCRVQGHTIRPHCCQRRLGITASRTFCLTDSINRCASGLLASIRSACSSAALANRKSPLFKYLLQRVRRVRQATRCQLRAVQASTRSTGWVAKARTPPHALSSPRCTWDPSAAPACSRPALWSSSLVEHTPRPGVPCVAIPGGPAA